MAVSFLAQSLMTLQDFTTHETSALIERILTRRANALGEHLRLVRQAVEAAERAAQSPPAIEEDVAELVNRLNQAFSATARRIQDEARKVAEQANRELESQRIANDALMTSVSGLEAEVDRQREGAGPVGVGAGEVACAAEDRVVIVAAVVDAGGDAGRVPVHAHDASERLKPERMRQPAKKFVSTVFDDDRLGHDRAKFRHALAKPPGNPATVKRKIGAACSLDHSALYTGS